MSYPLELERRIQEILLRKNKNVAVCRRQTPSSFAVFVIGFLAGVVTIRMCAPLHATKTSYHNQPWQIQYETSDEH